ncbi:MAG TPA: PilZ domain-containing protein [Terriglobia bacterium]|nr:PilZ domain-containing protein [Terriglobia bacterium]
MTFDVVCVLTPMTLSDQEFRREKRVKFTTRAPLATIPGDGELIENTATIDLSASGVRVRLSGQIEPGQLVEIFLSKRPEQCRVVWTNSDGPNKQLIAGLEFIYPLPDQRGPETPPSSKFEPIH